MFFKKRREAKKAAQQKALHDEKVEVETLIDSAVENAMHIDDTVARLQKLTKVEKLVNDVIVAVVKRIARQVPADAIMDTFAKNELGQYLGERYRDIEELIRQDVDAHVKEIAQSPDYSTLVALPGIARKFADAAARHIVAEEEKAAQEPAAPVAKEKADFSRLADLGRGAPKKNPPTPNV